ncbi:MerR family transcriptional regulator [Rhodococcus rhodnii]|nr:helix-turn-helix transcriptional regulator [Rhodococcus rhodnii]TXG92179.1 MerR family transcriptional regulator [Rhodococcus rhodnii]
MSENKRARGDGGDGVDPDAQIFVISVAAQLAGMHAQTLRNYDRLGLVTPHRTTGGGRRYSPRDVALLREVQRLSQGEGVNLAGIKRIIELTRQVEELTSKVDELAREIARVHASYSRLPAPVTRSNALVVWQPRTGRRGD